ncbi:MAG: hypothetical protein JSS27_08625 [Planctomycetes bacterium]|nr:hypothetical protein [Planctomycetota bacterium]
MKITLFIGLIVGLWAAVAGSASAQNQYAAMSGSYYPQQTAPTAAQRAEAFRTAQARARGTTQQPVQRVATTQRPAANPNFVPGRSAQRGQQPVARGAAQRAPQRVAWNQQALPVPAPAAAAPVAPSMAPLSAGAMPGWSGVAVNGGAMSGTLPGTPADAGAMAGPMGAPVGTPMVAPDGGPVDDGAYAGGGPGGCGGNSTSWPLCWEKRLWGSHYHWVWNSTGDMPQHMPYFPHAHGYYYFRPYNVVHGLQQQEMATRWGGDARDPYDIRLFEKIYQEHESQPMDAVPGESTAMRQWRTR